MSKPIYWAVGAVFALAIVWVVVRKNVPLPAKEAAVAGASGHSMTLAKSFREDIGKGGVDIQMIVPALLMGPLHSELDNPLARMSRLPDGRISYITFLGRRGT